MTPMRFTDRANRRGRGLRCIDVRRASVSLVVAPAGLAERQTRWSQTPLSERACGFESHTRHRLLNDYSSMWVGLLEKACSVRLQIVGGLPHSDDMYRVIAYQLLSSVMKS